MASQSEEIIVCPNCGSPASGNYCAQCGQETHLHKDTFTGLILHFVGHYFHYDSKFWQTIRALLFSPGLLTTAYWEKKRMRYIPPISLYIFISFVYFFTGSLVNKNKFVVRNEVSTSSDSVLETKGNHYKITFSNPLEDQSGNSKSSGRTSKDNIVITSKTVERPSDDSLVKSMLSNSFGIDADKLVKKHPDFLSYLNETFWHNFPKIFFS